MTQLSNRTAARLLAGSIAEFDNAGNSRCVVPHRGNALAWIALVLIAVPALLAMALAAAAAS